MKVLFKRPRKIDGVEYQPGLHDVDNSLKDHWFFLACESNGDLKIVSDKEAKVIKEGDATKAQSEGEKLKKYMDKKEANKAKSAGNKKAPVKKKESGSQENKDNSPDKGA